MVRKFVFRGLSLLAGWVLALLQKLTVELYIRACGLLDLMVRVTVAVTAPALLIWSEWTTCPHLLSYCPLFILVLVRRMIVLSLLSEDGLSGRLGR